MTKAVVDAVAEAEGVWPLDLKPSLATVVDPDALENLVESTGRTSGESIACVRFTYAGYDVTITCDGDVTVARR